MCGAFFPLKAYGGPFLYVKGIFLLCEVFSLACPHLQKMSPGAHAFTARVGPMTPFSYNAEKINQMKRLIIALK